MMTLSTVSCRRGSTTAAQRVVNEGRREPQRVDLEVHRALERNCAESPYLAHQLLVFDDRQLVTGLPGTIVRGHRHMQNSMVNAETTIYTDLVRRNSVDVPTSSLG
jgi:hypothetical protein